MNIILQINLFEEDIFENLGDLEWLRLVLSTMDDAELIHKLYKIREREEMTGPVSVGQRIEGDVNCELFFQPLSLPMIPSTGCSR